jgi:hypothetical protein
MYAQYRYNDPGQSGTPLSPYNRSWAQHTDGRLTYSLPATKQRWNAGI